MFFIQVMPGLIVFGITLKQKSGETARPGKMVMCYAIDFECIGFD